MRQGAVAVALAAVLAVAACSSPAPRAAGPRSTTSTTAATTTAAPATVATTAAPTTRPEPTTTTAPRCPGPPAAGGEPAPQGLVAALEAGLADPRFAGLAVSASIWVDGYGEVAASERELALFPASNQKLVTAAAVLAALPHDHRMVTSVLAAGDDLALVAGGDPTLTRASLDALAQQVVAAGVTTVAGDVLVDETRYEPARRAPGWQPWQQPAYVGPLSAFTVDDNRHLSDAAFLADPVTANGNLFRAALTRAGVAVAGATWPAPAPPGRELASLASPTVAELVTTMVRDSDNEVAEALTREAGVLLTDSGQTVAGVEALAAVLEDELCLDLATGWADGSGLSRSDLRSAADMVAVIAAARTAPWWPTLRDGLPVAGVSGTLAERFRGTPAEGNLRAKTGTIIGGVSLSGEVTTAGGRLATFSVIVNGNGAAAAQQAVDDLMAALAADGS